MNDAAPPAAAPETEPPAAVPFPPRPASPPVAAVPPRKIDWNAITALVSAIGLVLAASGLFFTASQIRLARKLAKSEFMREFYASVQQYNDIQIKLTNGGEWRSAANAGPTTEAEWFRLQRYMGLLEQVDHWHRDGLVDLEHVDSAYSHRIKAIASHPRIRESILEKEPYRWTNFVSLVEALENMPVYRKINYTYPDPVSPATAGDAVVTIREP